MYASMPQPRITPSEIQKYLSLLEETPRRIAACTAGLTEAQLSRPPGKGEWPAVTILAHLRACDDVWSYSIYAMLAQDNPLLASIHPRQWAKVTPYAGLDFGPSLQAFALKRQELLQVLSDLPEEKWARTAAISGRTYSVFGQARRLVLHEVGHCEQIESLIIHEQGLDTSL